jgi:hypothetical protein
LAVVAASTASIPRKASRKPNMSVSAVAPRKCRVRPGLTPAFMPHNKLSTTMAPNQTWDAPAPPMRFHGALRAAHRTTGSRSSQAAHCHVSGKSPSGKFMAGA